jgi:ABC-type transport system substrate-binding protein
VFVFLNTRDATLGDARVRQALSLAIDRQSLVAGPVHSTGVALRGPLLPGMWAADAAAVAPPNSVAAASQALDAAGWLSNGHGERLRAGAALTVTLLVDNDPTRLAVAQAVAMRWQAIGVTANVEVVGLDGMFRDFLAPGHYQAALIGLRQRGALPDLTDLWHSGGALNISAWTDPLADAALDATLDADAATRQIGYTRFARRFVDEMPAIPLYLPTVPFAVRGLRLPMTTVNDPADVLTSAESWRPVP